MMCRIKVLSVFVHVIGTNQFRKLEEEKEAEANAKPWMQPPAVCPPPKSGVSH